MRMLYDKALGGEDKQLTWHSSFESDTCVIYLHCSNFTVVPILRPYLVY